MKNSALIIILKKNSNPLKGVLSFYNFFLNGEISKLIYRKIIDLNADNKIILYKNDICKMFPQKIIFFINFKENLELNITQTLKSLKIEKNIIIGKEESNG